mgnify:CR=1 FL=1
MYNQWMDRWTVRNIFIRLLPALYGRLNLRGALGKIRQDIEASLHVRPLIERFIESIGVGVGVIGWLTTHLFRDQRSVTHLSDELKYTYEESSETIN